MIIISIIVVIVIVIGKHRVSEADLGGLQRHLHKQGVPPPPSQSQAAEMQRRSAPATDHS